MKFSESLRKLCEKDSLCLVSGFAVVVVVVYIVLTCRCIAECFRSFCHHFFLPFFALLCFVLFVCLFVCLFLFSYPPCFLSAGVSPGQTLGLVLDCGNEP